MFTVSRARAPLSVLALMFALAGVAGAQDDGAPAASGKRQSSSVYVVRMSEDPVVAYRGGIPGLRATKPARGKKIDPDSPDVVRYKAHLDSRHNDAIGRVGGARKLYDYGYTFNGFAAELTEQQAAAMAAVPGVVSVTKDELVEADTSS